MNSSALEIVVEPYNPAMKSLMGLTWETVSFKEDVMQIQIFFEKAIHISADAVKQDEIIVTVLDPLVFLDK